MTAGPFKSSIFLIFVTKFGNFVQGLKLPFLMSALKVAAGIDIGGTNCVFGLVERSGTVITEDSLSTPDYPIRRICRSCLEETNITFGQS
jgi:hypothetical protein